MALRSHLFYTWVSPQESELLEFKECVLFPSVFLAPSPVSGMWMVPSEHGNGHLRGLQPPWTIHSLMWLWLGPLNLVLCLFRFWL